ncbi:MAG TPA: DNA translocase FtsK [Candidatus Binataceae bacterium]|nr:DNA translocase FtsK [Candidatus Binataceae bacterium]
MAAPVDEQPAGDNRIARELAALAMLALSAFAVVSLASLHLGRHPNLCGPVGETLAKALAGLLGFDAYVLVVLTLMLAVRVWLGPGWKTLAREIGAGAIVLAAMVSALGLWTSADPAFAGSAGARIAAILTASLNLGGGYLAVGFALICGLALMLKRAPTDLAAAAARTLKPPLPSRRANATPDELDTLEPGPHAAPTAELRLGAAAPQALKVRRIEPRDSSRDKKDKNDSKPRSKGAFKLPPLSLLDIPPAEHSYVDEAALERSARVLEQKLADFGVQGRVVEVQPGPVVTMYKFEPGSGIKVSQIVNLADDLSMALRAAAVRIQAPVPGEAVVGIEVPNRKREMVFLREILESDEFGHTQGQLTIALGKDIAGRPMAADLARMPHLLIAGATGTGKSVSLHTMISSILFNGTADDVRFILIDPKMLELSVYENIPHLLVPVVVDPEKAASALLWATQEMETRYTMMRDLGVRNIDSYNRALSSRTPIVELKPAQQVSEAAATGAEPIKIEHRKLPKIVIVIDELADLLLSEGKTVERDITRLAQKARASGIHLILATQRPSVDVITGLIKANLTARISFQVTSRVDSRTILDSIGAERLLGAGDMLFMPPGSAKLMRLHGPFVSESEIRKVADFLRAQGAPDYRMEILETKPTSEELGDEFGEKDEMYDDAVRIVMETGQASISMIQRRLRIGYNRAARMVELMEHEGLVNPPDGARPREVRLRSVK